VIPFRCSVDIVGRLGKDPEKRDYTKDGKPSSFWVLLVGVDRAKAEMMPDGKERKADWFDVICNVDCSKLTKGDAVKVEGSLSQKIWVPKGAVKTKKDNWVTSYQVRADRVLRVEDDTRAAQGIQTITSSSLAGV